MEQISSTSAIKCKIRFADSVMSDVTFDDIGNYMTFFNNANLLPENGGPGLSTSIASAYVSDDRKELTIIYSISDKLPASGTVNYNFRINGVSDRFPITIDVDSINKATCYWHKGTWNNDTMLIRDDSLLELFTDYNVLTGDTKHVFIMVTREVRDGDEVNVESLRTGASLTIQNHKYYPAALNKEEALSLGWANINVNASDAKFTNPTTLGNSYDMYWMIFKIPLVDFINSCVTSFLSAILTVNSETDIFDIRIPSGSCYPDAIVPKIVSAKVSSMDGSGAYVDVLGSKDKNVYLPELIYNSNIRLKIIIDFAKQDFTEISGQEWEIMKDMVVIQFDNNNLFNKFVEYPDSNKYGDYVTTYSDYAKLEDGKRKYFKRMEFSIKQDQYADIDIDRLRHFKLSAFTFDAWNYSYTDTIFSNLNVYVPKSIPMLQCDGNFNDEVWWNISNSLDDVWLSGFQYTSGSESFIPNLISFKVKTPVGVNKAEYVKTLMSKAHVFFKLYNDYNSKVQYLKAWNVLDVRGDDNSSEALSARAKTMHISTSASYVLGTNTIKGVTSANDRYFTYDEMMTKMHNEHDFDRLNNPFLINEIIESYNKPGIPVVKNTIEYYYDLPNEEIDEATFVISLGYSALYYNGLDAPQNYDDRLDDLNELTNIVNNYFINGCEDGIYAAEGSKSLKFVNRLKAFVVFDDTAKDAVITSDADFSKFKNVVELPERKVTNSQHYVLKFDNTISRVDVLNPYTMEELQLLANVNGGDTNIEVPILCRVYSDLFKAPNQRFDLINQMTYNIDMFNNETLANLRANESSTVSYGNDSFIKPFYLDLNTLISAFPHYLSFPIAACDLEVFLEIGEDKNALLKSLHHIRPIRTDGENIFISISAIADTTLSKYMLTIPLALSSLETTPEEVLANIGELKINGKVIDKSKILYVNTPELQSKYKIPANIDYLIGVEGTLAELYIIDGIIPPVSTTYNGITKTW